MSPQRRVAVVIPCWNDGRFVAEAVASVQAQREPCELVVVDDGSTDTQTAAELRWLEQSGVVVVRQPNPRSGVGSHGRTRTHQRTVCLSTRRG